MRRMVMGIAFLCAIAATSLQAAVVRVFPRLGAVLNADFSPADPSLIISTSDDELWLTPRQEKYILQFDFLMTLTELTPGQVRFASSLFDIELRPTAAINSDVPGWVADTTKIDRNGSLPGGLLPKWSGNCDCNGEPYDLLGIALDNGSWRDDDYPPLDLGVPPYRNGDFPYNDGEYAGTVFVDLMGDDPRGLIRVSGLTSTVFDVNSNPTTVDAESVAGQFRVGVPEPSSFLLLNACACGLAIARCWLRQAR